MLFSPEDSAALYDGEVNPDAPDFEKFPLFRNATPYECTIGLGELLFMPAQWWHHVVGLEKSITVNYNFFNRKLQRLSDPHFARYRPLWKGFSSFPMRERLH